MHAYTRSCRCKSASTAVSNMFPGLMSSLPFVYIHACVRIHARAYSVYTCIYVYVYKQSCILTSTSSTIAIMFRKTDHSYICIYMYIYVYICMHIYIWLCILTYTSSTISIMFLGTDVVSTIRIYTCIHTQYIYIYVYVYVYIHTYIWSCIFTSTSSTISIMFLGTDVVSMPFANTTCGHECSCVYATMHAHMYAYVSQHACVHITYIYTYVCIKIPKYSLQS
jgi:hypothetical protein